MGQLTDAYSFYGFDYPKLLNDVGTFVVGLAIVQAVLDRRSQQSLVFNAVTAAVEGYRAVHRGVADIILDSRSTRADLVFDDGGVVTVCFNHSAALFDRIEPKLLERSRRGWPTKIVLMMPDGDAMRSEIPDEGDRQHAVGDIRKITDRIKTIEGDFPSNIEIYHYDKKLSYLSFSSQEHSLFVPYTNSSGRATVPAVCFKRADPGFHEFMISDAEKWSLPA